MAETERIAREEGAFCPRQFENPENAEAHRFGTASEIIEQIPGGTLDAFVSGVGTGGTLVALAGREEIDVHDERALDVARKLVLRGFPVGPSSGLNFAAAIEIADKLGPDARVVTVFPDRMERYCSTELFAAPR